MQCSMHRRMKYYMSRDKAAVQFVGVRSQGVLSFQGEVTFKPGLKGMGVCQMEQWREGNSGEGNRKHTLKFAETMRKTENPNYCKQFLKERAPLEKNCHVSERGYYLLHRIDFLESEMNQSSFLSKTISNTRMIKKISFIYVN